jgi:uncharacterized protein (DUF433 family)
MTRGWPIRLFPVRMNWPGDLDSDPPRVVVIDPAVSSGRPVVNGTGLMAEIIVGRLNSGEGIESIADDYGLQVNQIEEVICYAQQPEIRIFCLDRNLGSKQLAVLLENAGFVVRVHDNYFKPDEADNLWLASRGQRGWIAITPDKRILKDPLSMSAIGANKGRVFFLPKNNKNPQMWAPILMS